ncbi:hypothetical protein PBY51_015444 [Eleginops maclovinus]|uniref:Uncharacterized protein n=1 Tax=Eleginops maclovinus TaxID=56733 RepID=A0AAN8AFT0_ELEMC|nr:hypothetical protein PBY51_015444 [Eleginops maclovinus]
MLMPLGCYQHYLAVTDPGYLGGVQRETHRHFKKHRHERQGGGGLVMERGVFVRDVTRTSPPSHMVVEMLSVRFRIVAGNRRLK